MVGVLDKGLIFLFDPLFQLSTAGVVRLPRFEMTMARSESNSKPILSSGDVHLVTVYGS